MTLCNVPLIVVLVAVHEWLPNSESYDSCIATFDDINIGYLLKKMCVYNVNTLVIIFWIYWLKEMVAKYTPHPHPPNFFHLLTLKYTRK